MLVLSMVGWGSLSLIISCIFIVGTSELGAVGRTFAKRTESKTTSYKISVHFTIIGVVMSFALYGLN